MTTQRIFASRTQHSATTYIGNAGSLFYDEITGELRLSDGVTPGGVAIAVRADLIVAQRLTPALDNNNAYGLGDETHRWWDLHIGDGGIHFDGYATPQTVPYLPSALTGSLVPATDNGVNLGNTNHRFANIYLGTQGLFLADQTTDANINITVNDGTLYINGAENLRLGNLAIRDTTLTSANTALDISIGATDDSGFFYIKRKAQFNNTSFSSTQPMVSMNASGFTEPTTLFPDTVLQTTGRLNKNSRIVQRSYGSTGELGGDNSYSVWASYVSRGTVVAPAALKANDILARISANGYGTTSWGSGGARVEFVALENFTDTAKGTRINFWTVPAGQVASQNVASINSVGIVAKGIEFSNDSTVQTTAGIPLSAKAVSSATYVATLGIDGKLDATQIPSSLTGAVVFKGTWNAFTNTPALSDLTPAGLTAGWEYIVEVGGTRNIGDGEKVFVSGDFVIYDGTHWKQVPSGNLFTSLTGGGHVTVNQSTGAIVLGSDATPNATTATIVSRDASGNFSANVITANLTGNVTGAVSGNAGSVTNGVYTTGDQSISGTKTFTSTIQGTATNATLAAAVVGGVGVYTLTAGTGTAVSASSGTVTVWNTIPAFNTGTLVAQSVTAQSATTATNAAYAYSFNTSTLVANAVSATTATNAGYAYSFNTGTLVTRATTSTNAGYAYSFNTSTLVTTAVTAGTVTTAAQPAITSVGTLTNLTIASSGTITTPRIVINDGGLRTVSGGTTCTIDFAVDSIVLWTAPSGTAAITLQNYTAGAQVKLIIAMTTSRDVTYGISSAANSSDGADNFNGSGVGSTSIANTAMHLEYTCITAVAGGCYVKVTVL